MSTATIKDWRAYPPGKEKYQLYLASRDWAILKEQVRARSGGHCERCFAEAENVHHQTYERIYQERLDDLIHLCVPCHQFAHNHRSEDPVLSMPVRMMERTIRNVYLAGKITGTKWRDEIVTQGWSFQNHSAIDFDIEGYDWAKIEGCLPLADGRRLNLTGPFWRALPLGGHATIRDTEGPHAFTTVGYGEDDDDRDPPDLSLLATTIRNAIEDSDLLFAWIDSVDCFGTLAEIGYARAKHCVVAIACPPGFDQTELWLPFQLAHICLKRETPSQAWDVLFSPEFLRRFQ